MKRGALLKILRAQGCIFVNMEAGMINIFNPEPEKETVFQDTPLYLMIQPEV